MENNIVDTFSAPEYEKGNNAAPELSPEEKEQYDLVFSYEKAKTKLTSIISSWNTQVMYADKCRRMRNIECEVETLQNAGVLKTDETFIPIRVIDTNIKREKPAYVAYLEQSVNVAVFKDVRDPKRNTELLASAFTSGCRYQGWQIPILKCLDGAQLIGFDHVEIEYDPSKPFNISIDHVGNENLLFPLDSRVNLQLTSDLLRRYKLTRMQLRNFVSKYGWDTKQVQVLLTKKANQEIYDTIEVYKRYVKFNGVVYVSWFADKECSDWLKAPQKLFIGRYTTVLGEEPATVVGPNGMPMTIVKQVEKVVEASESEFPIRTYQYQLSENPVLVKSVGRAFLDETRQEAQTGIWTNMINGCNRASGVYGSPEQAEPDGESIKQIDVEIMHGHFYNRKINFWSPPYPDPMLIKCAQALDTQTQAETGQVNFAVSNRQDSRKTATEIEAATNQSTLLNSVDVSQWSLFLQSMWSLVWELVQSQAQYNKIEFLQIEQPGPPDMMGVPTTVKVNDVETIRRKYELLAAGDIDVVQKAEKINRMGAFWNMVAGTPVAGLFLTKMLKTAFPEDANEYEAVLKQDTAAVGMIKILLPVLTELGNKPELAPYKAQFQQIEQQIGEIIQPQAGTTGVA